MPKQSEKTTPTRRRRKKSKQTSLPLEQADPGYSSAAAQERAQSVRTFTLAFFESFQIEPTPTPNASGEFTVALPEEMAEHFGAQSLSLVFHSADVTSDTELVAFGSRLFDKMMSYLDQHSAVTVQKLPSLHNGADELLRAVHPHNAAIAGLQLKEEEHPIFIFNWHLTYRADDKREEIFTVVLDENQRRIPITEEAHLAGDGVLHLPDLLTQAEPIPPALDDNGEILPPKLPPMTHLRRLAESARKYALYHADVRCISHEAEILPRLHKSLSRLTSYYEQQIQEVYDAHDPTGEKRRMLEEDLQRKIAEEVENHRLRVKVRLFSYALLYVPVATAHMRLSDGTQEVPIQIVRNRFTGALRRPQCHACGEEITELMLCRNGHATCDVCSEQCSTCHEAVCTDCGLFHCPTCDKSNCETCSEFCWACGERACAEHISRCPVCGDDACHSCQSTCAECGERQCRSHLRTDSVTGEMVCGKCAARCPHCRDYSTQFETCSASGQQFCAGCMVNCSRCGKPVGPDFYHVDKLSKEVFCQECMTSCPSCGQLTGALITNGCSHCQEDLCAECAQQCSVCGAVLCAEHAIACMDCGSILCEKHVHFCLVGNEVVCQECQQICPHCESTVCETHMVRCTLCGMPSCTECTLTDNLCITCKRLIASDVEVSMLDEPVAEDMRIQMIWGHYRWTKASNSQYIYYLGTDRIKHNLIVVAQEEKVIAMRRSRFVNQQYGKS